MKVFKVKSGHGLVNKTKLLKQLKTVLKGKEAEYKIMQRKHSTLILRAEVLGEIQGLKLALNFIR